MRDYLPNIQYSLDGETFNDYTSDEIIHIENVLYIQWEGALFNNTTVGTLELQGEDIKVSGRLLHGDTPHAYRGLFNGCNNLTDASELVLSSETVGEYAYSEMFANCKQLVSVPELPATTLSEGCYSHMFYGCSSLTNIPKLPATILAPYCYDSMFSFCTSLETVPNLIDTDVDFAYKEMFYGCTGLEDFLDLTDEQLNSYTYSGIFDKCTPEVATFNLRKTRSVEPVLQAPSTLLDTEDWLGFINVDSTASTITLNNYNPAISYSTDGVTFNSYTKNTTIDIVVGGSIYFKWSGALKISSNNSAIITTSGGLLNVSGKLLHGGTQHSYMRLFSNSKQIKNTSNIELPATTVAGDCYFNMFYGCTSLTTAPELPATTLSGGCYSYMFQNCSSLTTAPELPATTLASYCYHNMFYGCTSLTTAPTLPATTLADYCYKHMFYGCTSLTTAPTLPATTLADYCYSNMFQNCTSLTTAPTLPATTLADYCYKQMFYGCTSLTTAPTLPATTLVNDCYMGMFYVCSSLTTFIMLNPTAPTNYNSNMFVGTPSTKVLFVPISATGYSTSWCSTTWAVVNYNMVPTEEIVYKFNDEHLLETFSSNSKTESLTIPHNVTYKGNGYDVEKLSRNSLANDNKMKTLTIESGINKIEASALSGCNNLETVNIPDSVTKIDNHAFWMCRNLKNIVLPSTLTQLKPEMFVDCISLETITIPDGITKIPFRMFEGCKNLKTVNLPDTITEIQWSAFKDCVSLTEINIPDDCEVDDTAFEGTSI
jgi:hypothetical protein